MPSFMSVFTDRVSLPLLHDCVRIFGEGGSAGDLFFVCDYVVDGLPAEGRFFFYGDRRCIGAVRSLASDFSFLLGTVGPR